MSQRQAFKYLSGGGAIGLSASIIFGGSSLFVSNSTSAIPTVSPNASASATASPSVSTTPSVSASESVAVETPSASTSGTFAGTAVAADRWGFVQVQIEVSAGEITDIAMLQYPDADHESAMINQQAIPLLISEVLASQSADVANISGATYTSMAFQSSLQAAMEEAGL